jgi:hypothetical protein
MGFAFLNIRRRSGMPPVLETTSRSSSSITLVANEEEYGGCGSEDESDEEAGELSLLQGAAAKVTKKFRSVTRIVLVLRFVLRLLKEYKTSTRKYKDSVALLSIKT